MTDPGGLPSGKSEEDQAKFCGTVGDQPRRRTGAIFRTSEEPGLCSMAPTGQEGPRSRINDTLIPPTQNEPINEQAKKVTLKNQATTGSDMLRTHVMSAREHIQQMKASYGPRQPLNAGQPQLVSIKTVANLTGPQEFPASRVNPTWRSSDSNQFAINSAISNHHLGTPKYNSTQQLSV